MNDFFRKFSQKASEIVGSAGAFIIALLLLLLWALSGSIFHFSDSWQLVISTVTSVITFFMVFLIQNTQNRDAKALHLKLDELIRSIQGARNTMINIQELSEDELDQLQKQFRRISKVYGERSDPAVKEIIEVSKKTESQ